MNRVDIDEIEFKDGYFHNGQLFTGTSVEKWPDGTLRSEQDFVMGMRDGWGREYNRAGRLVEEIPYLNGGCHGIKRHYYDSGKLAQETFCKFATLIWRKSYSEAGQLVDELHIDKNDWQYQNVLALEAAERQRDAPK